MANFDKLLFETIDDIVFYEPATNEIIAIFDQPKSYSLENTVDITNITGKNEVTLGTLERNKQTNLTFSNGYVLMSAISAQTGGKIEEASAENSFTVPHYELIELKQNSDDLEAKYTFEAVGVEGAEIPVIYIANEDKSQGERLEISDDYTLDPDTKTIKVTADGLKAGDYVIVPYERKVTAGNRIINRSDAQSMTVRCVANITAAHICDQNKKYHVIFDIAQGKLDGNNTLEIGDDGTFPEITINAITNLCSVSKELWSMYVMDDSDI